MIEYFTMKHLQGAQLYVYGATYRLNRGSGAERSRAVSKSAAVITISVSKTKHSELEAEVVGTRTRVEPTNGHYTQ